MGLMGGRAPGAASEDLTASREAERLFDAGVAYLCCEAWALAYDCFERSAREDAATCYNQALCCFKTDWYGECLQRLGEAERRLDDTPDETSRMKIRSTPPRQHPEAFRRWDAASELPRCPLLPETPRDDALTLILRLRAETAFRLGRYEEVRTIAARLGHRYKHLENLLKQIDR